MLIQLVTQHPEAIVPILHRTPLWVWGLLAGLLALGLSQLRARSASLVRISLLPLGMTAFSAWGTVSALGSSPLLAEALGIWTLTAMAAFALVAPGRPKAHYDAAARSYALPGSVVPLALIAGIFLVKYVVGVELAMAPQLLRDSQYTLTVAALYGCFSGIFVGRATRLWRLALRAPALPAAI
jgi:hypothetical protein